MTADNRIFSIQLMIDTVNIYNSYKYDATYGKLKVFVSKFLHYPPMEISSTPFKPNITEATTDIKVDEGKTFMFSLATNNIEPALKLAFVDFQVLLESDNKERVKAGIQNLVVGYTRIQIREDMKDIIAAVDTVKSETPIIKEIEGAYVIRHEALQVGTIFLGIRFTMLGSSVSASIQSNTASKIDANPPPLEDAMNTLKDKIIQPLTQKSKAPEKEEQLEPNQQNPQRSQQITPFGQIKTSLDQKLTTFKENDKEQENLNRGSNQQSNSQNSQYYRKPNNEADLKKEYTYVYSELNGQVIDMKIYHEPKPSKPLKMKGSKCL